MAAAQPSWDDIEGAAFSDTPSPESAGPSWIKNDADVTDFGPFPLDDEIVVLACEDCGKPVLSEAMSFHKENCKLARDIAEGRVSPGLLEGESRKRRLSEASAFSVSGQQPPSPKKSKKAEKLAEAEARRKAKMEAREAKKKEKKKGGRKNKGPLDVDKQCGVINDKGLPCSRSLTCKSHSMGAKRAVEGRSRPYDVLLFEWQKATNPTFVAKLEEKEKATAAAKAAATTGAKEGKKKKGGSGGGSGNAADGKNGAGPTNTSGLGDEDPEADMYAAGAADAEVDAELFAILTALTAARERALPLATRGFGGMYVARAKRLRACHELLREGLRGVAPGQGLNARSSQPLPAGVSGQNRGITAGSAQ